MAKMNITLPESFVVESRGATVTLDASALPADIINRLIAHGLTQKIGDAAASALADAGFEGRKFKDLADDEKAKVREQATASMGKVVDALLKGDWGVERTGGAGVDPVTAEIRSMLRGDVKKAWVAKNDEAGWKALEESAIVGMLDEAFAQQTAETQAAIRAVADANIAKKAEIRKAKESLGKFTLAM